MDLFKAATRFYFGRDIKPVRIPKLFVVPGILLRQFIGWLCGHPTFERLWMVRYVDKQFCIDPQKTQAELEWEPTPRLNLIRRLLILVENMKNHESIWQMRNEESMNRITERPNLILYEAMAQFREEFIKEATVFLMLPENQERFCDYHEMDPDVLKWNLKLLLKIYNIHKINL